MPNEINFEVDYHKRQEVLELFSEIEKVEIAQVGSRIFARKFPPLKKTDNDYVLYLDPNLMGNFGKKVTEVDLTITTAAPQQDLKPRWLNLGSRAQ